MMGQSCLTVRQSKVRPLGGGARFFSTHKPTTRTARVACPVNLAAVKPPLHKTVSYSLLPHCGKMGYTTYTRSINTTVYTPLDC